MSDVSESARNPSYWSRNLRITALLLVAWFVVTFAVGGFASEMNFSFFGWPFGFWFASQGALLLYCLIIWIYGAYMNRLDQSGSERDSLD